VVDTCGSGNVHMYRLIAVVRAANHTSLRFGIRGVANLDGGMMENDRLYL
jgi:hypothetical protein